MLEFPTDDWVAVVGNFGNPFALDALTGDEGVCHELAFGIGNTAGFVLFQANGSTNTASRP